MAANKEVHYTEVETIDNKQENMMLVINNNRRKLINFLTDRWLMIAGLAAIETVYTASCEHAKKNNSPIPNKPSVITCKPCRQIDIIKQVIMKILPETHFIDYTYESHIPLETGDFIDMYIADHHQCVEKIKELMERIQTI